LSDEAFSCGVCALFVLITGDHPALMTSANRGKRSINKRKTGHLGGYDFEAAFCDFHDAIYQRIQPVLPAFNP
jgi:hypothetical protein